tara:strand:- start:765 stop:1196 length:432 start_codon:yes stop_codon:yes gene_type:complete
MVKKNIPIWQKSAFDNMANGCVKTKPINKKLKELEANYLKVQEASIKVMDIDMSNVYLQNDLLKDDEDKKDNELEEYQEMRRLQREADLKKLREDETKVVFSKPIRQDPNRGMHFITNLTPINKGKLGSSRMFLKDTKVETYY